MTEPEQGQLKDKRFTFTFHLEGTNPLTEKLLRLTEEKPEETPEAEGLDYLTAIIKMPPGSVHISATEEGLDESPSYALDETELAINGRVTYHVAQRPEWPEPRLAFKLGNDDWMLTPAPDGFEAMLQQIAERNRLRGIELPPELLQTQQGKSLQRKRPADAVKLLPVLQDLHLPTQKNLTGIMQYVTTSKPDDWEPHMNAYILKTPYGKALMENIGTIEQLGRILDKLGPEGFQFTLATLHHIAGVLQRKHGGNLPEWDKLNPIRIICTDLLRTMGKAPTGNTYSRTQQMKPREFLIAQSLVHYVDIKPTNERNAKLNVGPVINILDTEIETPLPLDDIPNTGEVISIAILPGKAAYDLIRKGISWCSPKLLHYHPHNQKYAIQIGFYLEQLSLVRRNKAGQEWVSLGTIERGSGVNKYDEKNVSRRLDHIKEALDQLAKDSIIPAQKDPKTGQSRAILKEGTQKLKPNTLEGKRDRQVKIATDKALPETN